MASREELLQGDVESRPIGAIEVDLQVLMLVVEQTRLFTGSMGEPDALNDARPGGLRQDRVAVLDAEL